MRIPESTPEVPEVDAPADFDALTRELFGANRADRVNTYYRFIGLDGTQAGIFDRRIVDFHLSGVQIFDRDNPYMNDRSVVTALVPAAVDIGCIEKARWMLESLPNETSKAYGYRRIYHQAREEQDGRAYLAAAREANPRCTPAQVVLGRWVDIFNNRSEMLADVVVQATIGRHAELAKEALEALPEAEHDELAHQLANAIAREADAREKQSNARSW